MKFLLGILLVALSAVGVSFVLPWWTVAIFSAIVGALIGIAPWKSWIYGFLGLFLVWGIWCYIIDQANESILSNRMADLFGLENSFLLILISALIGGFLGGFGAMTGSLFRKLFSKQKGKKKKRRKFRS